MIVKTIDKIYQDLLKKITRFKNMPYTVEDGGRLNNFAQEPKMYVAEAPTKKQQRNFIILGVLGMLLIGGLIGVAVTVSSLS